MAYKIQFDNGHTVEFDSQPNDSDIEEAYAHTQTLKAATPATPIQPTTQSEPGFSDKVIGGLEAAGSLLSSGVAMPLGFAAAAMQKANNPAAVNFEDQTAANMGAYTYAPRTELGQEYAGKVGQAFNDVGIPAIAHLGGVKLPSLGEMSTQIRAGRNIPVPEPVSKIGSLDAALAAKKEAPVVEPLKEVPQTSKEAYQQALRERELQRQSAFNRPDELANLEQQSPMERMASDLGAPKVEPEVAPTPMTNMARDLTEFSTPEARAAQDMIDLRQKAMEEQIARQTALEQGAAGRARQENAPVGSPEMVAERQRVLEQAKQERTAKEIANQDPALQAAEQARIAQEKAAQGKTKLPETPVFELAPNGILRVKKGVPEVKELPKPTSLESASQKVASDRLFDMTAEERVMWEKTKAVVQQTEAGPTILSDKQVLAKVQDRAWVKEAINKIRQRREMFDEIAKRSSDRQVVVDAMKKRELLTDQLQEMETTLSKPRPDNSSKQQGPKTLRFSAAMRQKQGGYINFGMKQKPVVDLIKKNEALAKSLPELVSVHETPEGVVKLALDSQDVSTGTVRDAIGKFTKGFLYEKFKTNNPIIKYTYDRISQAVDEAKVVTHQILQKDLLPKLRSLSKSEMTELHGAMLSAMKHKTDLSADLLREHGFNEKQVNTWESFQSAYKKSFDSLNDARATMGKPPVDPYKGYMAGMSTGDYRTTIVKVDSNGVPSVVGIIGSNSSKIRDWRVKKFLETHPEYKKGTERFYGAGTARGNRGAALVEALSLLSDYDPNVKVFADQLADHLQKEAYSFQGAKRHTMQKKGVFGMEGDKPWLSAEQNAKEGFQAQIRYMEIMAKWAELSKAAEDLKKVYSDPALQEKQANAIAMSTDYLKRALGQETSKFGKGIDIALSAAGDALGLGPSYLDSAIRGVKGGINTVFFALRPTFIITNMLQGLISTPKMLSLLRSRGMDIPHGVDIKAVIGDLNHLWGKETPFSKKMWEYGEQHGISNTQIFEHSTSIRNGVGSYLSKGLEAGMGMAEGVPRSMMYSMFSTILKDNGYANHPDIFKVARELTDMSMGDYRYHESQPINSAMGPLSPLFANLSTFAGNENSMIALLAREAKNNKSYVPLLAAVATGLVVHGVMGFPGFDEADKVYKFITEMAGKPSSLSGTILNMASNHKEAGDALAMGMPAYAGIDTHQILGRSSALPALLAAGGSGKALDIAGAAINTIKNPSEMNLKRLGYEVVPGGFKGLAELAWFGNEQGGAMSKKEGHANELLYNRSPEDITARKMGLTTTNEAKNKAAIYQQGMQDVAMKDKQTSIINKLKDQMVSHDGVTPDEFTQLFDKYVAAEGNPKKFIKEMEDSGVKMNVPALTRYLMTKAKSGDISSVKAIQRLQEKEYADF